MFRQYIQEALERANYEMIDDAEPYYGEVKGLQGVRATGNTLEECRRHLEKAIEDWICFSYKHLPGFFAVGDSVL